MNRYLLFLFLTCLTLTGFAQLPDTTGVPVDSLQQTMDSLPKIPDSVKKDSVKRTSAAFDSSYAKLLRENRLLNSQGIPVSMTIKLHKDRGNEFYFYLFSCLLLLLGVLKLFFSRYFTTLFRVFFNTSLRQSQLTDQLLQARLPSLLFNLFFVITGGIFLYFLLKHYGLLERRDEFAMMGICMAMVAGIYLIKYSTLKFTGWVTGFYESTNAYVFIIFLINKIIGVLLVPLVILIAFSGSKLAHIVVIISLICVGFLLILRFFRSYGLLQNQLKISRFHFFLYIVGIELVPLLLIYKAALLILSKNP